MIAESRFAFFSYTLHARTRDGSESCRTVGNAPYDTVSAEDQGIAGGLWAAMRLLLPAAHGVIDGGIYPLPNGESSV